MFCYCMRESHSLIKFQSATDGCYNSSVNHVSSVVNAMNINVENQPNLKVHLDQFFSIESLGTHCIPRCGGCKCGSCTLGDKNYTVKEERELAMITQGSNYNSIEKYWSIRDPWIKDANDLPNNVAVAIPRMKSTDKSLKKLGYDYTIYNDQIQDMTDRGEARKLSWMEINTYKGPVHYIHRHKVLNHCSFSTPVTIVFNSSADYKGHKLNDHWSKGPYVLDDLVGILLRFRQDAVAVVGNISKMYNAIKFWELEQHTHRFVWWDVILVRLQTIICLQLWVLETDLVE